MFYSSIDFARAVGVSVTTVHRWDDEGKVVPVKRSISGRRQYSEEQVQAYLNEDYSNPVLKGKKEV